MTDSQLADTQPVNTQKTPDQLVFNLRRMKNGQHRVKGKMSKEWWKAFCQELGLPEEGEGYVDLIIDVSLPRFRVYGDITMTLKRQCVRTLDAFDHKTTTHIDEQLTLQQDTDDGGEIFHDQEVLDMGEYLRQQLILAVDPHPVKGDVERGGVVFSDGLDDEPEVSGENPFAVLKDRLENK